MINTTNYNKIVMINLGFVCGLNILIILDETVYFKYLKNYVKNVVK